VSAIEIKGSFIDFLAGTDDRELLRKMLDTCLQQRTKALLP